MDYNWITLRLSTGAALSGPDDAAALVAAGVTHIIDCIDGSDDTALFAATVGCLVLWNPTADDGQTKPPSWFETSLAFALPALALPHAKVYAHCAAGVNRGPSTAYAIMRALGWGGPDAEAAIRKARPQVNIAYKDDADAAILALGYC